MTILKFTPYAWAKLIYMRDRGPTEVAGYGISSIKEPLLVTDFVLVKQESSAATFSFDDKGLADYFDDMIDENLQPAEFMRIWIHTHPGNSASPSGTDETTFAEKFNDSDWAIMFILARGGDNTTALKYKTPECRVTLKSEVDFHEGFGESREEEWEKEYMDCVEEEVYRTKKSKSKKFKATNKNNKTDIASKHYRYIDDDYEWAKSWEEEQEDIEKIITQRDLTDFYNKGGMY
jgi:proteasome lid subunit RPN8/RPN11